MDHAKIIVDGHERSKTDREGHYKLDQVKMMLFFIVVAIFMLSSYHSILYFMYYELIIDKDVNYEHSIQRCHNPCIGLVVIGIMT